MESIDINTVVANDVNSLKSRIYNAEAARKARQQAEEIRRKRIPFDRQKFEDFVRNDPLISKLLLLATIENEE